MLNIVDINCYRLLFTCVVGIKTSLYGNRTLCNVERGLCFKSRIVAVCSPVGNYLVLTNINRFGRKLVPTLAILLVIAVGGLTIAGIILRRQRVIKIKDTVVLPALNRDSRCVRRCLLLSNLQRTKLIFAMCIVVWVRSLAPLKVMNRVVRLNRNIRTNLIALSRSRLTLDNADYLCSALESCTVIALAISIGLYVVFLLCNLNFCLSSKRSGHATNRDVLLDLYRIRASILEGRLLRTPSSATVC